MQDTPTNNSDLEKKASSKEKPDPTGDPESLLGTIMMAGDKALSETIKEAAKKNKK